MPVITKITNHEHINETQQLSNTCEDSSVEIESVHPLLEVITPTNIRPSTRIRKLSAKAFDMSSNRQKSNAAIELAYSAARDTNIDFPSSYEAALESEQADK